MRLLPLLMILVAASCPFANQEIDSDGPGKEVLEKKLHKFQGMRTTGFVLGGIGAAALLGGIVLASNGEWETEQTPTGSQTNAKDGAAAGGLLLIAAGIPTTVLGIVLGSIGSSKVRQYQTRLQNLSLDLRPGHTGLRVSYRF